MSYSIKALLKTSKPYYYLKYSFVYDIYWKFFNPEVIASRNIMIEFYQRVLKGFQKGDMFFDVGANMGFVSDIFLRIGANVIAIEPDNLCNWILNLRFKKKGILVINSALSNKSGKEYFFIEHPGSAKNTLSKKWVKILQDDNTPRFGEPHYFKRKTKVTTTTLDTLIEKYGKPFFIKIDVEGNEVNVLRGLSQEISYISFELNLPEYLHEGVECVEKIINLNKNYLFNYTCEFKDGLALSNWVDSIDFIEIIKNHHDDFMEIFCKLPLRIISNN